MEELNWSFLWGFYSFSISKKPGGCITFNKCLLLPTHQNELNAHLGDYWFKTMFHVPQIQFSLVSCWHFVCACMCMLFEQEPKLDTQWSAFLKHRTLLYKSTLTRNKNIYGKARAFACSTKLKLETRSLLSALSAMRYEIQ